ncbi:MAG: gamma-glutamyltransferase [Proteobacteria bacterium]|nr:gamma-glutamyltransferase [Pseudomonadota bacterium]
MLNALLATRGMVTAPNHQAAQSGLAVLREGGTAIEAAVAAAATIAVAYPHMNAIGGDGFWLIDEPGRPPVGIDACGRAAGLADLGFYRAHGVNAIPQRGPLAANTVAGAISGWQAALEISARWGGRLPLARLLQDAIGYARDGVPTTGSQVAYTTTHLGQLKDVPGFAAAMLDADKPPLRGAIRRNAALAATLVRLAKAGLDDFYRGEIAAAMAAELERLGTPLRREDLADHRAAIVAPLQVKLRAGTTFNLPPPTQGMASLMILGIFDRLGCAAAENFDYVHRLVEATKQAFLARNRHVADPATMTVDPASFLTEAALAERARAIDPARALPWPVPSPQGGTIWFAVIDGAGRAVSYIQSVYWEFGSGVVLGDSGVLWQNRGASFALDAKSPNALAPGRKPFHTLNPALAHLADGRVMAYGTMGGEGQPQTQAALFTRYAMFGQGLQAAVTAPRWLLGRTWGAESTTLKLERRFAAELIERLRQAGHDVEMLPEFSDLVGHAGALVRHPGGVIEGAADPRADGVVAGF